MMHTIVEEGLTDENYIKRFTEGFDELKTHLKDFAPEDMAEICGIDAVSYTHLRAHRDATLSRMPSSA